MKCSVYIATSVDGYIARSDGQLDWLQRPEFEGVPLNGLSYADFMRDIDCIVMGRNTFEKVLTFEPWPYEGVEVTVVSGSLRQLPGHLQGKARLDAGSPQEVLARLQAQGRQHAYIDGGQTIRQFLDARLVHTLTLTRIPVLLGQGIALFPPSAQEHSLRLIAATVSDSGIVQERYALSASA